VPIRDKSTTDVIIIGGGVIGLSLAWELARRGKTVVVLESKEVGRGASWAGAGILPASAKYGTTDAYEQLRALSHQLHPIWAKRLFEVTGTHTGFQQCGGLYLARSPAEAATLTANQGWWESHGIEFEKWSVDQLRQREPNLAGDVDKLRGVWFLPDECQLRNPRHMQALAKACQLEGVELVEFATVENIEAEQGRGVRVKLAEGERQARQVCLCSGAWTRQILEQLQIPTGILPVRGQMVLYHCPERPIRSIVNEGHRYLVPRDDGRLLAGSIEEEAGYAIETTPVAIEQISGWAEQLMPGLKQCPVEQTWAGLRPGSFDGFPYIGRVPGFENLYVAAGHFRSGLHLSCATAVVLANEMLGAANEIDLLPFRVGRG
jgi:glycine oxidase